MTEERARIVGLSYQTMALLDLCETAAERISVAQFGLDCTGHADSLARVLVIVRQNVEEMHDHIEKVAVTGEPIS